MELSVETVNWFKSYLSDRRQCVKVNGLKSNDVVICDFSAYHMIDKMNFPLNI